jgi:hypothetical protein
VQVHHIGLGAALAIQQLLAQARGGPGDRVQRGIASAEAAVGLLGEARLQATPDGVLGLRRTTDHRGIVG